MNVKNICGALCGVYEDKRHLDVALLLLRLTVGFAFIFHGWSKVTDLNGTLMMLSSMGVGTTLAYIAAYTEFLGGVAIMLGIGTRLAGGLLTIFMIEAIYLVHINKGYSMINGGYEYQLLLLVGVLFFALVGPGKYSLHNKFCKNH